MSHQPLAMSRRGFTLIEIAMVLVIVGLLLTMGLALFGTLTKRAKYIESREAVKQAKEAVLGYAVKNGFLPATLEAAGARKLDSWTRDMQYYATAEIDASPENACGVNTTSMEVYECTDATCTTYLTKSNIAFIVYSKGEDANGTGTGTASPFRVREQASSYTDGSVTYEYDDIVQYVSLDEIRSLRGCPKELDISSPPTLTSGTEDTYYSYSLQATGGYPAYTWSVSGQTIDTLGCTGNSYPIGNPNYSLCLYRDSGLLSGVINYNSSLSTGELVNCSETIAVTNVTVQDSSTPQGSKTKSFSIPIRPQALKIISETLPSGSEGSSYSVTFSGTGGKCTGSGCSTSYNWTVDSGSLPSILSLSTAGVISGTIDTDSGCSTATYNFSVKLNDDLAGSGTGCGQPNYKGFSISVNDPDCAGGGGTTTTSTTTTTTTTTTITTTTSTTTTTACPTLASYRVWNEFGARRDFWLDGVCDRVNNGSEITNQAGIGTLNSGENLLQYSSQTDLCDGSLEGTLTYSQAACCDTDGDGRINYVSDGTCSDR